MHGQPWSTNVTNSMRMVPPTILSMQKPKVNFFYGAADVHCCKVAMNAAGEGIGAATLLLTGERGYRQNNTRLSVPRH